MIESKSWKTRITAPAHLSATGGRVSGLVFLALKVSNKVQWESKLPQNILLLKRLTIALENRSLKKNHSQNKNENVVDIFCDTDALS